MPFHAYTRPADYVYLFPKARSFIYADSDTVSGNVVIYTGYQGLIREPGSNRVDSPTTYNYPYVYPDVGPVNQQIQGHTWGTVGGEIYAALTPNIFDNWKILNNGYDHNDVSVDVRTTTGTAGIIINGHDHEYIRVFLDIASLRVKADRVLGSGTAVSFTGTTAIVAGTSYRLRAVEVGETVSVYLNGNLEGSFSLTGVLINPNNNIDASAAAFTRGVGLATDNSGARFSNFYVAPQAAMAATTVTVRNYDGDIIYTTSIASLPDPTQITIPDSSLKQRSNRGPYGWYRVYLTGPDRLEQQWGTAYGDCSFCRISTAAGFAANALTGQAAPGFSDQKVDEYARGVMGIGPARYELSSSTPIAAANAENAEVFVGAPILKSRWVDNAFSLRPRRIVGSFVNGTQGIEASIVTPTVNALKASIKAWESRNEPNFFVTPTDFVNNELIPFYNAVKAADPTAFVLAPDAVTYNNQFYFNPQFFAAGGHNYIDAYSVHAYNCTNGDLALARRAFEYLTGLFASYGFTKPVYQTEQGFGWEYAGLIYPRYAGRWTALMWFVSELYGLPVENNVYWYDSPIGFDAFPMDWTSGTGIGPQPVPIRTMVAEIGNRTLTAQFDFGTYGQSLYAGGTWTAVDGSKTVGLMATSFGQRDVTLTVSGASSLTCVDTWGNTFTLNVNTGQTTFPISEMPQWIRCPVGVTVTPVALGMTTNLATSATVTADGTSQAGLYNPTTTFAQASFTDATLINNEIQDNPFDPTMVHPYAIVAPNWPVTITLTWPAPVTMNRVLIHTFPPWQVNGTPVAFTVDTWDGSTWTNRYTKTRPSSKSFPFTSGAARCTYETFFDEPWVFDVAFTAASVSKVRMVITDATYASGEIIGPYDALWEPMYTGTVQMFSVREIQVFNASAVPLAPRLRNPAMGGVI